MSKFYIINNIVEFHAEQHLLVAREDHAEPVLLNTPASRCLHLLIENQHSIISQQEFFVEVWSKQGAWVSINTFYQNISLLRKALVKVGLGDEIVKTVARKGLTLTASTKITVIDETQLTYRKKKRKPQPGQVLHALQYDKNGCDTLRSAVDEETGEKEVSIPNRSKYVLIGIATLLIIMVVSYSFTQSKKVNYFSHYQPVKVPGECRFFTEKEFENEDWLAEFINENNIICDEKHHVFYYLTTYRFSNRYSLIKCNKNINMAGSLDCISMYFLQKKTKKVR